MENFIFCAVIIMPPPNIHVIISFYNGSFLCLIFLAQLIHLAHHCVFWASTLNSFFVLLEVLFHYQETSIIRSVFRNLSNMMELLAKTGNGL